MNFLDWTALLLYIVVILWIAARLSTSQRTLQDYYLAGRQTPGWQSGLSTMATQLSAISFISAPAFVALKPGGGLKWLCYEFGVPLGLLLVMAVLLPTLHQRNRVSIYSYLEQRFDSSTRTLVSFLFLLGRGLATAVAVLAGGLVLSTVLSIPTATAIVLVGAITILYDILGGLRVVILTDVLQMGIIVVGVLICGATALSIVGWEGAWAAFEPGRAQILHFHQWGLTPEGKYGFWPMLIGGIFLYASYYGCDQSQMQREISVPSLDGSRQSLMVNALGRFPVVLAYCLVGVFVGAVFTLPETLPRIASALQMDTAAVSEALGRDPDRMLPFFILGFLPHGVIGLIFVAIMAALMSSLDSALNSLSAVTVKDFYQRHLRPHAGEAELIKVSKLCTGLWGLFCVAAALQFAAIGEATRQTTLVLINAVGSLLYGPILAAFLLGVATRWVHAGAVKLGVVAGIAVNICLWQFTEISWLWWNVTGFITVVGVAALCSLARLAQAGAPWVQWDTGASVSRIAWGSRYRLILLYFGFILLVCLLIQWTHS